MSDGIAMKVIDYRGGLVRVALPAHWTEEYEPDGGATFFDPSIEAVTLRLHVLTFKSKHPLRRSESAAIFDGRASSDGASVTQALDEQSLLICCPKAFAEKGEALELHSWQLGRVAPPDTVRIAVFATTVLVESPPSEATQTTLTMLLDQVRNAIVTDVSEPTS
jgi:hypothetical protein